MKKLTGLLCRLLLISFLCGTVALAQRRGTPSAPRPRLPRIAAIPLSTDNLTPERKARVEAFEKVWRTIAYYYFDGKFNNVNWEALKFELEPRVRAARTDAELHDILEEMLRRLKSSHLAIIRPVVFETIATAKETARQRARERESLIAKGASQEEIKELQNFDDPLAIYGPGIDLRLVEDRFVVFRVGTGSAGEYRGIKQGFVVESIDDVELAPLVRRMRLISSDNSPYLRRLPMEIVDEMLNGDKDTTVKIGYLDHEDKKGEVIIRRELLPTSTVSMGDDHPELQLSFVSKSLDADTGYIHFDNFSLPVVEKFCAALSDLGAKKGLIIDLRGNTGGIIAVSLALAGMLSAKPLDLGTSIYRYGPEQLVAEPKAKQFKGNIAVLTDELSVSAAEMFAASLQAAKRATVVGTKSAGESLPSVTVEIPTGARLMYPIANYRTADGRFLEGSGVVPDQVVRLDRASLIAGRDPQIEAAKRALKQPPNAQGPAAPPASSLTSTADVNASAPPPPAPPKPKPVPKQLASVTIKAPPPPAEPPDVIEPKAVELIREFERLSGGITEFAAIKTYEISGSVDTVSMAARNSQEFVRYRDGDLRELVVLRSPATGESRTFRDGKIIRVTSEVGVTYEAPSVASLAEGDFLYSLTRSMKPENYRQLKYLGVFDRKDRKVHLIDGKTLDGTVVAIYFDTETKLLAGFEGPTGGLSFGDYRKIGNLMFPYNISSQDFLNIQLTEVKLNSQIDPSVFERKVYCFDKQ